MIKKNLGKINWFLSIKQKRIDCINGLETTFKWQLKSRCAAASTFQLLIVLKYLSEELITDMFPSFLSLSVT